MEVNAVALALFVWFSGLLSQFLMLLTPACNCKVELHFLLFAISDGPALSFLPLIVATATVMAVAAFSFL